MRARAGVKQEVLLITDGMSNHHDETVAAAKQLQNYVTIFGLSIGHLTPDGQQVRTNMAGCRLVMLHKQGSESDW